MILAAFSLQQSIYLQFDLSIREVNPVQVLENPFCY